jgi:hypothetical protein
MWTIQQFNKRHVYEKDFGRVSGNGVSLGFFQ